MAKKGRTDYDVIIVGSGPAGAFSAYELINSNPNLKILILEKGPWREIAETDNNLFGWMGAGAFSDGKLTLTPKTGGQLADYLSPAEFERLMKYVEFLYEKYGGRQELKIGDEEKIAELIKRADVAGLDLIPYPVKHWGREGAYLLAQQIWTHLENKGVQIILNSEVVSVDTKSNRLAVQLRSRKVFYANFLILAPGRAGADWLVRQMEKLGVEAENNPVDLGVRVEAKKTMLEELTNTLYDFKLKYKTAKRRDEVRTFCVCPGGRVIKEQHADFTAVNGQTDRNNQTENTNFAILVSMNFTEPFRDPNAYGRHVASQGTLLANNSVLMQTLADFQNLRRSKPSSLTNFSVRPTLPEAAPGDLRLALPDRFIAGIAEMLKVMDRFIPGINNGNKVLLYGIEVKFYSRRIVFQNGFETKIPHLYVVGDGSGLTRGLLQSTIMGIKVAQDITSGVKI